MADSMRRWLTLSHMAMLLALTEAACGQEFAPTDPPTPAAEIQVAQGRRELPGGMENRLVPEVRMELRPLAEIPLELIARDKQLPPDSSAEEFVGSRPAGAMNARVSEFHWQPANFFHQPLYFDDTPLERYGQSVCPRLQPVVSGTRFFLTFPILPYKIGVDRTHDCVTTAGLYRPGSYAPCVREVLPREKDATLFQTATTLGWIFLLP